ncbi:MAG: UvrD-helicase domain-containing protein [Magnetococcales bacterium]|nr:UvrD-helicase domain-containing protein [Magnetococcales bacterium]
MNHTPTLADSQARKAALDPEASFIVQAPAGSGKTGLLTQRFLTLLSRVNQPEEIIAITFTRKAAGEMKNRILESLEIAGNTPPAPPLPEDPHERLNRHLAEKALARDQVGGWQILLNPNRLRILTIDSLCASLTARMPLLSRMGGRARVVDQGDPFYQQAAQNCLALVGGADPYGAAAATLLDHLDNNLPRATRLLAEMLATRDQWLRRLGSLGDEMREPLEGVLQAVQQREVAGVLAQISPAIKEALIQAATFAAANLQAAEKISPLNIWLDALDFPDTSPDSFPLWQGLAELLLTQKGEWRKQVNAAVGFPAPSGVKNKTEKISLTEKKKQVTALLKTLARNTTLARDLHGLRSLPPSRYSDQQWRILQALLTLLPMAAAQLQVLFMERGQVDHTEITLRALAALGEPDNPTDLALSLDYRLGHILVDEFQDTSVTHHQLLERLTAGWNPEDGRTLFLVGDPMQSIYRFREADVGIFLKTRRDGLAGLPLIPLNLTVNFRSQQGLVHWANAAFAQVLPQKEDPFYGAVSHTRSDSFRPTLEGSPVTCHPFAEEDRVAEGERVVALVREAFEGSVSEGNKGQVAILARSRSHLVEIVPALTRAGIPFQAVEIRKLADQTVVQDLLALTRAITHPADRVSWLAILRAPWCGLTLADLDVLAGGHHTATLWDLLNDPAHLSRLSRSGRERLEPVRALLTTTLAQRRRTAQGPLTGFLRRRVEGVWLALGGPACLNSPGEILDAERFFDLLEEMERGGVIADFKELGERVEALFAGLDPEAGPQVQVMTIHKAKGLEFDTVILPGLGRRSRGEQGRLLAWMEPSGESLLLAPIKRSDQGAGDPIHDYLMGVERQKGLLEAGRLLYVAATRAKKKLHLLGHLNPPKKGSDLPYPPSGSLLALLWPAVERDFTSHPEAIPQGANTLDPALPTTDPASQVGDSANQVTDPAFSAKPPPPLHRLAAGWRLPKWPPPVGRPGSPEQIEGEPVPFEWAGETIRLVGVVVHRYLCRIARDGIDRWSPQRVTASAPTIAAHLIRQGLPEGEGLDQACVRVQTALRSTLIDPRGQWLLSDQHTEAHSELALTGLFKGNRLAIVMDRTFIDGEGVCWIVDYKVSVHRGGDDEAFLDNEQTRYRDQLQRYGAFMQAAHPHREIRLGLYFPMLGGWRSWIFQGIDNQFTSQNK